MTTLDQRRGGPRLEVSAHRRGPAVALAPGGRLTVESDTGQLERLAEWFAQAGVTCIVLNLAGVRQLDCAGIGTLLRVRARVGRQGVWSW